MHATGRRVQRRMLGGTWDKKRSWKSKRRSSEMHWSPSAGRRGRWRRRWRVKQVREKCHSTDSTRCMFWCLLWAYMCMCVFVAHVMEKRLAELETLCKQKEEERVELELKLTEVKENLKKSLARGALGPPTDTKTGVKVSKDCCCFTDAANNN